MTTKFRKITVSVVVLSLFSFSSLFSQTLQSAMKLFKSEQFSASSSAFKKLIAQTPNDGDIYFYYGISFLRKYQSDTMNTSFAEMADSSKTVFELGTSRDPANPLNFIGLGGIELFHRDISKAEQFFAKAISLLPSKANKSIVMAPEKQSVVYYMMAEEYIRSGYHDTTKVFQMLRKAEQLYKKDPMLYIVYGDAYILMLNEGSKAISNYNIAQGLDPKSPEAKLRVGQLWMRARNYPDALSTYKEVVKIDSTFAPAYRELGYLYSRANRNDEAQKNYNIFLTLSANNNAARKRYVNTLIELKKYPEAANQLEIVIKVDTMDNDVNRALAYCYFETGQYDKGLYYSKKFFTRVKPEKVRATDLAYLGRLLVKSKQDSLAHEKLLKAFQMDTSKAELLSEAAMSLVRIKKYDKALDIYKLKISIKKANPMDWYSMGKVYYNLQQWGKADTTLAYFNTLMPDHIAGYRWRANALSNSLDPDAKLGLAKPVWDMMVTKAAPDSAKYSKELLEAYNYLAYYYLLQFNATKDQENGKKALEYSYKILAIDPANEKGKEFVKQIEPRVRK
ncbi:MAG: tetratricopeptide repeat protein [Bacteroidota bacterium]